MKFTYLVPALILLPLYAFSSQNNFKTQIPEAASKDISQALYTSESGNKQLKTLNRSIDYPTQIIRVNGKIEHQELDCTEVHKYINKILVEQIAIKEKFDYAIYVYCQYNPDTSLAISYKIESYFDPLTNEAITDLDNYLSQYNGIDLFGTPFKVESAKGLIVSLNLAAGMKKNPKRPPFIQYRKDRSNFYFKSNYEMKNKLFTDIYQNFYSNNADQILPFLDKWIFMNAGSIYRGILRDSNYVEIEPERIFLMKNGEKIFISGLKQYFMKYCQEYENHRCLKLS